MSEDEKLQRTQQEQKKNGGNLPQEAIAFLNAAVGGSNTSQHLSLFFLCMRAEWTPYWLKDRFSCSGAFFMCCVDKLSLLRYHTVWDRERKVNFDSEKDSSSSLWCCISLCGSLVREMYQQSEASKNLCCQLCVHVFGEPVLGDGDKKLFRYENENKMLPGLN